MKHLFLPVILLPVINSSQSDNLEVYRMSWIGWAFLAAAGIGIILVFVLRKGVVIEENTAKDDGNTSDEFKPVGDYLGGHPEIKNPVPGFVFRRNSHCCMFFYSNHSDDPPELRFKIRAGSFRNISVENPSSLQNDIALPDKTLNILRKKRKDQLALLRIDWIDGESKHSALFSFEGIDARLKADTARESLLKALN